MIQKRVNRRNSLRRRGLTLIELMASVLLLMVLMAALSGIVPRFVRQAAELEKSRQQDDRWLTVIVQRISEDLMNADKIVISGNGLQITGRLHRDATTARMTDRTGVVTYWLVKWKKRTLIMVESEEERCLLGYSDVHMRLEHPVDQASVELGRLRPLDSLDMDFQQVQLPSQVIVSLTSPTGKPLAARRVVRQPLLAHQFAQIGGRR